MAGSPRSEDAPSLLDAEAEAWLEESGTRQRPPGEADDTIEELDTDDLEIVEPVRVAKPRRSTPPPAPPLAALKRQDRVDIDAIVRDASRKHVPVIPSVPIVVTPRRGPSWAIALALSASAMIVGASTALVLVLTSDAPEPLHVPKLEVAKPLAVIAISPMIERASSRARRSAARSPRAPRAATEHVAPSAPTHVRAHAEAAPPSARTHAVAEHVAPSAPTRVRGRAEAGASAPARQSARRPAQAAPITRRARPVAAAPEAASTAAAEPASAAPSQRADLPEQPSRADVEGAITGVLPSLRECASGLGVVQIELHFAPSGRTTVARADSSRATPEQRSCMARAARAARVPPFSGPHLTVRYPAQL